MKNFEPIDWEFYVTKWNTQRKKGDAIEKLADNHLPDEGESTTSSETEKKEETKEKEEPKEEKTEEIKEQPQ